MEFDDISEDNESNNNPLEEILLFETDENQSYTTLKDCVIFLLDCSESMQKIHNGTFAITQVLTIAESFLKTKIITNEKDLFGLVLFNTGKTVNEMNFEGVNHLIQISPPDASLIKKVKILQQNTNPALCKEYKQNLQQDFGILKDQSQCFLSNALWICHSELKKYDQKNYKRRIFLFTDNDNPLSEGHMINERNIVIQRAKDMLESEIIIELFPTNFETAFDLKKFYMNVIPISDEGDEVLQKEYCEDRLRELTKRIRQKEVKKRTMGKCPFFLTNNTKIYMNVYASIKKATKGKGMNVDAKSNKLLSAINQVTCKDTGANLYPNQIGTYHVYGNKKILFTTEEMKKIKTLDDPGIKLMGFKSMNSIKPYFNTRGSLFLYPNENYSNGSSQLCDALIKQLLNKNKCAIVKFVPREGSLVKFCALIPQKEAFDEDHFQTPPGFNLIFLPFAEDIRSNADIMKKMPEKIEVSQQQREITRKLINKMNINFDCHDVENPSIQKFYATLQALALEENEVENVDDLINPDNDALKKVLHGLDGDFCHEFFGERTRRIGNMGGNEGDDKDKDGEEREAPKKKGKGKGAGSKSRSRSKSPDVIMNEDKEEFSIENLKSEIEDETIKKYTVPELKDICKLKKIPIKGSKKADIIESIRKFVFK